MGSAAVVGGRGAERRGPAARRRGAGNARLPQPWRPRESFHPPPARAWEIKQLSGSGRPPPTHHTPHTHTHTASRLAPSIPSRVCAWPARRARGHHPLDPCPGALRCPLGGGSCGQKGEDARPGHVRQHHERHGHVGRLPRGSAEPGARWGRGEGTARCHRGARCHQGARLSLEQPGWLRWPCRGAIEPHGSAPRTPNTWRGHREPKPNPRYPRRTTRAHHRAPKGRGSTWIHRVAAPRGHQGTKPTPTSPPVSPSCSWPPSLGTWSGLGPTRAAPRRPGLAVGAGCPPARPRGPADAAGYLLSPAEAKISRSWQGPKQGPPGTVAPPGAPRPSGGGPGVGDPPPRSTGTSGGCCAIGAQRVAGGGTSGWGQSCPRLAARSPWDSQGWAGAATGQPVPVPRTASPCPLRGRGCPQQGHVSAQGVDSR